MKNLILSALLIIAFNGAIAQTTHLENLHAFTKMVVKGDVKTIIAEKGHSERPRVTIEGVAKDNISEKIEAGVLYLTIDSDQRIELTVSNSNLNRIETENEVEILGAEVVGSNGKYLLTDFTHHHGPVAHHMNINIPKIDIDLPGFAMEIPEMDFDFDHHFDHDFDFDIDIDDESWEFNFDWDDHREEMKHMSKEVKEEMKRAMEEVKKELKKYKKH